MKDEESLVQANSEAFTKRRIPSSMERISRVVSVQPMASERVG